MPLVKHWMEGGNAFTRFMPEELPKYEKAIELSGMTQLALVKGVDYLAPCGIIPNSCALVWISKEPMKDLGPFWEIFHSL